jgi:hypothetical protein
MSILLAAWFNQLSKFKLLWVVTCYIVAMALPVTVTLGSTLERKRFRDKDVTTTTGALNILNKLRRKPGNLRI